MPHRALRRYLIFLSVLAAAIIFASPAHAVTPKKKIIFNEVEPGYAGDAANTVSAAQNAPVLDPGIYTTRLISETDTEKVFEGPTMRLVGTYDSGKDIYKLTVYPGVLVTFKVIPHNNQNIALRLFDKDGNTVHGIYSPTAIYKILDEAGLGFPETLQFIQGADVSYKEDGLITLYVEISEGILGSPYRGGRYTIDYSEENKPDAGSTVDAPNNVIYAQKIEWGKTYTGYLGGLDRKDCYMVDPKPAIGEKVTITVKPLDPKLDVDLDNGRNTNLTKWFYDARGNPMFFVRFGRDVRLGSTKYRKEDIINKSDNGAAGFPNTVTVYPYYATQGSGDAKPYSYDSDFTYLCPTLVKGAGNYELIATHGPVSGAAAITETEKENLTLPPAPQAAPEAPSIREKKLETIIKDLETATVISPAKDKKKLKKKLKFKKKIIERKTSS